MKDKGFTLIELLVVVAIIGILAAVGVVAYSGYTTGARISILKQYHKETVKEIKRETLKCELGEDKYFETKTCPVNAHQVIKALIRDFNKQTPFWNSGTHSSGLYQATDTFRFGHITLYTVSKNRKLGVIVRTCFKDRCSNQDIIVTEIFFD
tara:strand:+ start:29 stop:484 length:456 start_codon:yes stop_codon:yes gene_type:complete